MIERRRLPDGNMTMALKPIDGLFADSVHYMDLVVCSNPLCDCGNSEIVIFEEEFLQEKKVKYQISIDVGEQSVNRVSNRSFPKNKLVEQVFEKGLTEEDWRLLNIMHLEKKFRICTTVDINEVDYQFPSEYLENETNMFVYREAFPSSFFFLALDNELYILFDHYCKNPFCDCSSVYLEIFKSGEIKSKFAVGGYTYDYQIKKGKIETERNGVAESKLRQIKEKLFETYPDLDTILEIRHSVIKGLYAKEKLRIEEKRIKQTIRPQKKSIGRQRTGGVNREIVKRSAGRNAPCPCGSGKKYKRCCMKKS